MHVYVGRRNSSENLWSLLKWQGERSVLLCYYFQGSKVLEQYWRPEKWWMPLSWRHSRSSWIGFWASWSVCKCPCSLQGGSATWALSVFSSSKQLYDSMRTAVSNKASFWMLIWSIPAFLFQDSLAEPFWVSLYSHFQGLSSNCWYLKIKIS